MLGRVEIIMFLILFLLGPVNGLFRYTTAGGFSPSDFHIWIVPVASFSPLPGWASQICMNYMEKLIGLILPSSWEQDSLH